MLIAAASASNVRSANLNSGSCAMAIAAAVTIRRTPLSEDPEMHFYANLRPPRRALAWPLLWVSTKLPLLSFEVL